MRPPENWKRAPATLAIAGVTIIVSLLVLASGRLLDAASLAGFIPARVEGALHGLALLPVLVTPLTATLVHASVAHLVLNLIVLLFCGRAVENIIGSPPFVLLYVLGAYGAVAAQYLASLHSLEPMIGASGAISAVIGAYAALFGRNKVKLGSAAVSTFTNALWMVAAWVVLQYLVGFAFRSTFGLDIAVAAHVGGFVVGLAIAKPLLLWRWRRA